MIEPLVENSGVLTSGKSIHALTVSHGDANSKEYKFFPRWSS